MATFEYHMSLVLLVLSASKTRACPNEAIKGLGSTIEAVPSEIVVVVVFVICSMKSSNVFSTF